VGGADEAVEQLAHDGGGLDLAAPKPCSNGWPAWSLVRKIDYNA
jgi:hypothetical protein